MLLSHRVHRTSLESAHLELHRAITPTALLRRARIQALTQDERVTRAALGVDCARRRRRVVIVLEGSTHEYVDGKTYQLVAGTALFAPAALSHESRTRGCDALELEWDYGHAIDDGAAAATASQKLGFGAIRAAEKLGDVLRAATEGEPVRNAFAQLLTALRAEGMAVTPGAARVLPDASPQDQRLMHAIDHILKDLEKSPMLVDLQALIPATRRTLTRRIRDLHERYGLTGRGGAQWRGIRDAYRLVVASILLSHDDATPRRIAGLVGYGSVDALDHAFRHAKLEAPGEYRKSILG